MLRQCTQTRAVYLRHMKLFTNTFYSQRNKYFAGDHKFDIFTIDFVYDSIVHQRQIYNDTNDRNKCQLTVTITFE